MDLRRRRWEKPRGLLGAMVLADRAPPIVAGHLGQRRRRRNVQMLREIQYAPLWPRLPGVGHARRRDHLLIDTAGAAHLVARHLY